jgi:hypothetical protein
LIPSSMVGCTMRSATRKNGQNGTDRSTGPDRNRSRRMSRVRPHPAARARTPSCSGRTSATTHASRPIRSWASDRRGAAAGWEIIPEFQHPEVGPRRAPSSGPSSPQDSGARTASPAVRTCRRRPSTPDGL